MRDPLADMIERPEPEPKEQTRHPRPWERQWQRFTAWLVYSFDPHRLLRLFSYCLHRFMADGCTRQAAGLSYVSLLSLVPMLTIALAALAGFEAFDPVKSRLQNLILEGLLPQLGANVSNALNDFIDNAGRLTGPGVIGLAVTAVLLLSNITSAMNAIFHVAEARPLLIRLLVFWALLTLGPLLLGASFSISGYAFAAIQWAGVDRLTGLLGLSRLVSILLAACGFALIYVVVPNRSVRFGHAFTGGLVAALLLEVLKFTFGLYLRFVPGYQAVYGALAALPIFLVWMYLSWSVVLFGGEVAAALPEWRAAEARGGVTNAGPGARLALALAILSRLRAASLDGRPPRERQLVSALPATPVEIDRTLSSLRRGGILERTLGGRWLLARDLTRVTLAELAERLNISFEPGEGWPVAVQAISATLAERGRDIAEQPLAVLFDEGESLDALPKERRA